jgi:hypothetical protein
MHTRYCWESEKERNHVEKQYECEWIILKLILERDRERGWIGMDRINLD